MTDQQLVEMILISLGAALAVLYVAILIWWLEQRAKENERHRQRLDERDERDPGCHAWSAHMAYVQTHGALIFNDWDSRSLDEAQRRIA